MQYIVDIILVAIFVLAIVLGHHRGFLRTVVQFTGCIAAFLIALALSGKAAAWVYDDLVAPKWQEQIAEKLKEDVNGTPTEKLHSALEILPDGVYRLIDADRSSQQQIAELESKVGNSVQAVAETLTTTVIRPFAVLLLRFVAFVLLFVVLMLIVKILTLVLKPATKLPVIRQADGLLGGVVGALKGFLFVFVAVAVMRAIVAAGGIGDILTEKTLDDSFLVNFLLEHNPLS